MQKLSLYDFIQNRRNFKSRGRSKEAAKAQKMARQEAYNKKANELRKQKLTEAEIKAEVERWMKTQAALHDPDQIAGGFADRITGMGDKRINSSLGSQWRRHIDGLDKYVEGISKGMSEQEMKNTLLSIILTY